MCTYGDRGDPRPRLPTLARTQEGMVLRRTTTGKTDTTTNGKVSGTSGTNTTTTTTSTNSNSDRELHVVEERNMVKLVSPAKEYLTEEGVNYEDLWVYPDDEEPGKKAVQDAVDLAFYHNLPVETCLMYQEDEDEEQEEEEENREQEEEEEGEEDRVEEEEEDEEQEEEVEDGEEEVDEEVYLVYLSAF